MFYWCRSGIWKLKCGAEVCSSQTNYVALREGVEGWMKEREGDSGIFSLSNLPFCLEILPPGWCPAPGQGLWHEWELWSSLFFFSFLVCLFFFFFFPPACLVTTAWEQADRSRVARCQYRLQESISSQTGSEIGGGSYRFLRWFLVSFSELVWFRLVRYYFELGWDKHSPGAPDVAYSLPISRGTWVDFLGSNGMSRQGIGVRE